jgi:poly-D-alanine transfer protein DltD
MKDFLFKHLIPLSLAMGIAIVLLNTGFRDFAFREDRRNLKTQEVTGWPVRLFPSLVQNPSDYELFTTHWLQADPIVIFGSSELSYYNYKSIPYHFFSERGIPCAGIGSAGNQCMNIMGQLMFLKPHVRKMRVVIMLSPGWFEEYSEGTALENFLFSQNDHTLHLMNGMNDSESMRYIDAYVSENINAISHPSSVLSMMAYRHRIHEVPLGEVVYSPLFNYHEHFSAYKADRMQSLWNAGRSNWSYSNTTSPDATVIDYHALEFNWDSAISAERKMFLEISNGNDRSVNNEYYEQWLKGKPLHHLKIRPIAEQREFADLKMLLQFLKECGCKPLFVMQPFNPYCMQNLKEFDQTEKEVAKLVTSGGFEYFSLYTSAKKTYQPGTLTDIHHLGEAGWYMINRKINSYFFEDKK